MNKVFGFLLCLCVGVSAIAAQPIELNSANTVTLRGEVNDQSVSDVMLEMTKLAAIRGPQTYKLYLVLDTPGGDISAGEDLIMYLRTIPDIETITIFAASMGSAIVQSLPGKRHVTENGILMFHRAAVGLRGQISDGEFESRLRMIKAVVQRLEERNYTRMNTTQAWYKNAVKDELWLVGAEGVTSRAADDVSAVKCSNELVERKNNVLISFFLFEAEVTFSGCPLLRSGKAKEEKNNTLYQQYKAAIANRSYWRN